MSNEQRTDWIFRISKAERKEKDVLRHKAHMESMLPDLRELIRRANKYFGANVAVVERVKGEPVEYTLKEMKESIEALGTALLADGFKGKHIAILAENSYDWLVAFFAIACGVGVAVPLDKELDDEALSRLLDKADCEAIFCTKPYFRTAKKHMESHPDFRCAFSMYRDGPDEKFINIDTMIARGKELIAAGDRTYIDAEIDNEAPMAILFTSGTTGANKGVMLSHKNICANVESLLNTIPTEYSSFSVLPMNHVYELSCNCCTALYMNAVIYINDSLKNVQKNLMEFKPEAMVVVPMVIEGLYAGIWANARQQGKEEALKKLVAFSNKLRKKGIDLRPILFKTIQKKFCVRKFPTLSCGGAPSRAEYMTGMGDFGFRIYNGYGMTEASPSHTVNLHAELNPASAGKPMPWREIIVHDPDEDGVGELWLKGDNIFQGYYKDPEATAASFEDGWFKSGDYGRMTEDGELYVCGRKKNLIILENGENIFPEDLEFSIMDAIGYVTEVVAIESTKMILGRPQKVIAAVTYIDPEQFDPAKTPEEIEQMYKADISALNKKLPSYKKIQDVILVDAPMEKNSTRKIIRQKIIAQYSERA